MSAVESHRRWDCFRILFEGPIGALDLDKTWWVYDELDQLAARWRSAIQNSRTIFRGPTTTGSRILSTKNSEKFGNSVDGRTHAPVRQAPKQWEWKNAYHSFEHALVGYIVGQQLNDPDHALLRVFQR